jgi:hypothetical protein
MLTGLTAGLLFALARRITNPWVALLAWLVWTTTNDNLRWRATYYSEVTTGAMVLLAWWSVLHWRLSHRRGWIVLLAVAVGWGAITRPLTMMAFTLPLVAVTLPSLIRTRAWGDMSAALAVTVAILAVVPIWSRATIGRWSETPVAEYTRAYLPWDTMGFGMDPTSGTRVLPVDLERVADEFRQTHEAHTLASLPGQLWARAKMVAGGTWHNQRVGLLPFVALGIITMPLAVAFAFGSGLLLLIAYALYAHPPDWTVYYLEFLPVLALVTALGLWRAITFIQDRFGPAGSARLEHAVAATGLFVVLSLKSIGSDMRLVGPYLKQLGTLQHQFKDALTLLPTERSIVFVRYEPNYVGHFSLVENVPDLDRARTWVVYDRGVENEALLRLAPDRTPYLFDQARHSLVPLDRANPPTTRP